MEIQGHQHLGMSNGWIMITGGCRARYWGTAYKPPAPVRLNRSQRWDKALTYQQAREQSPSSRKVDQRKASM